MKTNEAKTEFGLGTLALRTPHSALDRVPAASSFWPEARPLPVLRSCRGMCWAGRALCLQRENYAGVYRLRHAGTSQMPGMLAMPEVQIVAVCDPVKESHDYLDWSKDGCARKLRGAGQPGLAAQRAGHPGGREVAGRSSKPRMPPKSVQENSRAALPMLIFANCSRRKKM